MKIKPGDRVRVVNPVFIIRVGYPLSIEDGLRYVQENLKEKIDALGLLSDKAYEAITKALAYDWLLKNHFGGAERSLHTYTDESLVGKHYRVLMIKRAVTGRYVHSCTSYEGDYEQAYLRDQEFHQIAELSELEYISNLTLKTETCNIELV